MLNTEFGGMNEVTADLYADTGDRRWLALSDKFEHHAIVEPLAEGKDILAGKHGNTLVPKMLGELMRYVYTGNATDGKAAMFFWDQRGPAPHLCHRWPRAERILRPARQARLHDRGPHLRNLQRIQHDQNVAGAVLHPARYPLRRLSRAGLVQPHPRVHRSGRRLDLLHGPRGPGRPARVRAKHARRRISPAAWEQEWKAMPCTVTACITNRATSFG